MSTPESTRLPQDFDLDLVLVSGDQDPNDGLKALAHFLIQVWETQGARGHEEQSVDSWAQKCHPQGRSGRELELPVGPDQTRPNKEV
ncbi:MAG: hypothetical protein JKY65_14895 [Planctomycetes bacterium]|nr:hypothetical protein [Planctomycetota bacterium]